MPGEKARGFHFSQGMKGWCRVGQLVSETMHREAKFMTYQYIDIARPGDRAEGSHLRPSMGGVMLSRTGIYRGVMGGKADWRGVFQGWLILQLFSSRLVQNILITDISCMQEGMGSARIDSSKSCPAPDSVKHLLRCLVWKIATHNLPSFCGDNTHCLRLWWHSNFKSCSPHCVQWI